MANQAYLSVCCKEFSEGWILEHFRDFLQTVPFSAARPGLTHLVIRAVDDSQPPLLEQDLRLASLGVTEVVEIAREQLHTDCSYEVGCFWDLATIDPVSGEPTVGPQPLGIICRGEDYEGGLWRERGHLEAQLGFEHLFTGHAGLLGVQQPANTEPQSPEEARFLQTMAWPENLDQYQKRTRDNIRQLLNWVRRIEKAVPVERAWLWSEGEENFEARLEEIVAAR
ncbi:MAG TPA: hypothetical protein VEJ45_00195 [Candidatus Acidoferrales bacterium]|nr:hypothetical protein [Candidatus Acidoferrales bacterium]